MPNNIYVYKKNYLLSIISNIYTHTIFNMLKINEKNKCNNQ